MKTIGTLAENRLALIPPRHWKTHEFCFFLHDNLVRLLVEYESSGAHEWVSEAFKRVKADLGVDADGIDMLSFMKEHNLIEPYRHHLISHLVLALTSDMLHFLYEALSCFEKRKFSVAYSLLRKPLKENLLFLSWLLGNKDDFLERFAANNYQTLNGVGKDKQIEILAAAIQRLATAEAFDASLIRDIIYSKSDSSGFEPIWQRATHLITSQGELLKTEDYTINFIFESSSFDHYFDLLYSKLPYLLIFVTQVTIECFNLILKVNEKTFSHLVITTMGCYEALFLRGRAQPIARLLNKSLEPFLKCIHCGAPLRIDRRNAPALYLDEHMRCKSCGLVSQIPLYWLFCVAKVSISREHSDAG
ncbi:MAG: hypothetical protein WB930_12630 [Syntrophobacteraceae bacterium]